jgi:hypothetical protein
MGQAYGSYKSEKFKTGIHFSDPLFKKGKKCPSRLDLRYVGEIRELGVNNHKTGLLLKVKIS